MALLHLVLADAAVMDHVGLAGRHLDLARAADAELTAARNVEPGFARHPAEPQLEGATVLDVDLAVHVVSLRVSSRFVIYLYLAPSSGSSPWTKKRSNCLVRVLVAAVVAVGPLHRAQDIGVTELLLRTPGISMSRNGGYGTSTSLRIRGAESEHTVAVIDGVKLNDPSSTGGGFNFANLDVVDIERIEVLDASAPQREIWLQQGGSCAI